MTDFENFKKEWMKDPEFINEYEALEEEFSIASSLISARAKLIASEQSSISDRTARLCCTKRVRDSCRESSVVAGLHEQTYISDLQNHELG